MYLLIAGIAVIGTDLTVSLPIQFHCYTSLNFKIINSDLNNQNDQWKLNLDIDDSDLKLTPILRPYSSTRVETFTTTQKPVRIIPGPASIVQAAKLLKQTDIQDGGEGCVMLTQEYIEKVVEDEDFRSGSWVNATEYVNANGGIVSECLGDIKNFLKNEKLDQVVAIVKTCTPNVIGDLIVTLKDLLEIVKLLEEEEMAEFELQVCGNVTDQEDLYKFDGEALNLALKKKQGKHKLSKSGSSGALKPSTHLVIAIFLYILGPEVETTRTLEVDAMGASNLVEALKREVKAVGWILWKWKQCELLMLWVSP
uniref:Uncharacterized protein n=1 Tax=Tanacetum cinerariifolium TaxID=118510 RepID=A0A6L2K8C7_TANCI|nr:hypothetical protein [Tanacetum cinerariifolium]